MIGLPIFRGTTSLNWLVLTSKSDHARFRQSEGTIKFVSFTNSVCLRLIGMKKLVGRKCKPSGAPVILTKTPSGVSQFECEYINKSPSRVTATLYPLFSFHRRLLRQAPRYCDTLASCLNSASLVYGSAPRIRTWTQCSQDGTKRFKCFVAIYFVFGRFHLFSPL